jgi:hypothetical protein
MHGRWIINYDVCLLLLDIEAAHQNTSNVTVENKKKGIDVTIDIWIDVFVLKHLQVEGDSHDYFGRRYLANRMQAPK